jgi:hypothetical protein
MRSLKSGANQNISYETAVKRIEGSNGPEEPMVVNRPSLQGLPDILHVKLVDFVAFITTVVNGTAKVERKSRKITIIVDVAEQFLGLEDFSAEEMHGVLARAIPPSSLRA